MGQGRLVRESVVCPWHSWIFRIETGWRIFRRIGAWRCFRFRSRETMCLWTLGGGWESSWEHLVNLRNFFRHIAFWEIE